MQHSQQEVFELKTNERQRPELISDGLSDIQKMLIQEGNRRKAADLKILFNCNKKTKEKRNSRINKSWECYRIVPMSKNTKKKNRPKCNIEHVQRYSRKLWVKRRLKRDSLRFGQNV